jgi:hypothetical protein
MESHYNPMTQAVDSTPPANAALSNSPTFYRSVGLITGCALLAASGIAGGCIFVAALPLFPVLLVGVTLGATLATACIWSIYRLKKLNEEPKKQQTSSEPPEEEKPPIEIPEEEKSWVRIPEKENTQHGISYIPGPETSFEGEQPVIGTLEPSAIPNEPKLSGPTADEPEPLSKGPRPQPQPIKLEDDPLDEVLFTHRVSSADSSVSSDHTLAQKVNTAKTTQPVNINSPDIADKLANAKSLHFHGMEDGKCLFVCSPETGGSKNGTYFYADNIGDVWAKLRSVTHFRFLCKPQDNFQISGDNVPNLESITFYSDKIAEIETAKHLIGLFENLERITFRKCNNMHSAKVNGSWKAGKLNLITFECCSAVDDIHVGSDLNSEEYTNNQTRTHPKGCSFGGSYLRVDLCQCKKLFEKEKHFSNIKINSHTISGETNSMGHNSPIVILCRNSGVFEPKMANVQKIGNTSTIHLQLPNTETLSIDLARENIEPHTIIDFNLKRCSNINLQGNGTVEHLEFIKPIDRCRVEFMANPNGTLLEINEFPKNSTTDTGNPFRMSFLGLAKSKLPKIKINGGELSDIKWYKLVDMYDDPLLIPVIRENLGKVDGKTNWIAIESESTWIGGETVELNSDFLLPQYGLEIALTS